MRLTFTVHEVAGMLGVSSRLIYEEIQRGNIAAIMIGKRRVIPKAEVERLVGSLEPSTRSTRESDVEVARLLRLVVERMES